MKAAFSLGALLPWTLLPGALAADPSADVTLTLLTSFEQKCSRITMDEMEHEVQAILQPSGIRVRWLPLAAVGEGDAFERLTVVRFKGCCDVASNRGARTQLSPLGFAHASDGEILPFAEIRCDCVKEIIRREMVTHSSPRAQALLGRALARVVAHELYHILTGSREHHDHGVAKCPLTPYELLKPRLELPMSTHMWIKQRLVRPASSVVE